MHTLRLCVLFWLSVFIISNVQGQEMTAFELVDNISVGLTAAPSSKWGVAIADIDRNGWPDIYQARASSPGYSRIYLNNQGIFQAVQFIL